MRRILLFALFVAATTSLAFGQQTVVEMPTQPKDAAAAREVLQVQKEWNAARIKGDQNTIDHILAGNFMFTIAAGKFVNKQIEATQHQAGELKYVSIKDDDIRAHVLANANVVILTGHRVAHVIVNGHPEPRNIRFTHVYAKINGRWQVVAAQHTPINPNFHG